MSNAATVWPRVIVSLPPLSFEPGSCRVLLRERGEVAAGLDLGVDLVGQRLLLDEDVADVAALGHHVLLLVVRVVLLHLGVGDGDRLRHLVVDLLGDELRLDVAAERLRRVALDLELGVELRLVAGEVLLLDLVDASLDLLVRDGELALVRLLGVLGALDEKRDGLALQRLVLAGAGLRERALLGGVGLLRAIDQRVEAHRRDRCPVDCGNGILRDGFVAAAAPGRHEHGGCDEEGQGDANRALHESQALRGRGGLRTPDV